MQARWPPNEGRHLRRAVSAARRATRLRIGDRLAPPVRQGELYRAALDRPAAIGLIDGYFEVTPTVWHKEILWAMGQGVHVYGAASIGALRAAELDTYGMKGIGRIYEDFRDGVLEDDDEVAVLHGPEELGYPALTEAMVNIRATLNAALRAKILSTALATQLTVIGKSLFYKERTYQAVLEAAARSRLDLPTLARLNGWLPTGRVDQKRLDFSRCSPRSALSSEAAPVKCELVTNLPTQWRGGRRRSALKMDRFSARTRPI